MLFYILFWTVFIFVSMLLILFSIFSWPVLIFVSILFSWSMIKCNVGLILKHASDTSCVVIGDYTMG
jgi:hypothetical protein